MVYSSHPHSDGEGNITSTKRLLHSMGPIRSTVLPGLTILSYLVLISFLSISSSSWCFRSRHLSILTETVMFASSIKSKSQFMRLHSSRLTSLSHQYRSQSTLSQEKAYWNHIPSWKNISNEEFMSYRWQVCQSQCLNDVPSYMFLVY